MKKILVIDDDQFFSKTLEATLPAGKYTLLSAEDGEIGLELAKKELPAVILLDIMMPKMDGFAVLTELKKDSKTKNIPVLLLTNLGQKADIEKGQKLGANDYIVKSSMTPSQVLEKIKSFLK